MQTPPVLFIIFNRPDTTQRVFDAIRSARPGQLFVAADGPRTSRPGEQELCEQSRAVLQQVDWPCEVQTLLRTENVGCNAGVTGAINWFFSHVEEGIILEDDCLPHPDFWTYTATLLETYRNNREIKMIGSNNFQQGHQRGDGSYYFSAIPHIWGWATWKRAWLEYDFDIAAGLSRQEGERLIRSLFPEPAAQAFWVKMLRYLREKRNITWDYRLPYSIWKHQGLTIIPNVNLVSNIGFSNNATSTTSSDSPLANAPVAPILPLKHPQNKERHTEADLYYCNHFLGGVLALKSMKGRLEEMVPWKLRKQIRSIIQNISGK